MLLPLLAALTVPTAVNATVINESLKEELNSQLSKAACELYSKNKEIYPGEYRQIANEIYIKSEKFRSKYLPLRNKKAIDYFDSYYPLSGKHSDQYLLSLFENSCKKDSFAIFKRLLDPSENRKTVTTVETKIQEKNLTNQDSKHKKCLNASDYEGCMKYQSSSSLTTKKYKLKPKDCMNKWCNPFEIDPDEKDNLGLKLIPGFWFYDSPVRRASKYISEPYKLKVNGNYGRYIHIIDITRYYSEGSSGTSGYSTTIGGSYTNCTGSGSSITCSTSPSTTINTPGKSGTAPGIKQRNKEVVIDCEEGTIAEHINDKLIKTKGMNGKKRKWLTLDNYGKTSLPSMYARRFCEKNNYEKLPSSPFLKYANKNIRK